MKNWISLVLILLVSVVHANDAARLSLSSKLGQTQAIQAHFSQTVRGGGRLIDSSEGMFYLLKPARFRLDITKPMTQQIVSDGHNLWIFDKDLEQVTKRALHQGLSNTPALFLSDTTSSALKHYEVSFHKNNQHDIFLLTPKAKDADYQHIELLFSDKTLLGLRIKDNLDQLTTLTLTKIKMNPHLSTKLFHFIPPRGVDIVTE